MALSELNEPLIPLGENGKVKTATAALRKDESLKVEI